MATAYTKVHRRNLTLPHPACVQNGMETVEALKRLELASTSDHPHSSAGFTL